MELRVGLGVTPVAKETDVPWIRKHAIQRHHPDRWRSLNRKKRIDAVHFPAKTVDNPLDLRWL